MDGRRVMIKVDRNKVIMKEKDLKEKLNSNKESGWEMKMMTNEVDRSGVIMKVEEINSNEGGGR